MKDRITLLKEALPIVALVIVLVSIIVMIDKCQETIANTIINNLLYSNTQF